MSDRELLPPNATAQEIALAGAVARISDIPIPIRELYRPEACPEALLPWLAWTFSLDDWSAGWGEQQKRDSIANSVFVHRHKGTIGAVRGALVALGVQIRVQEWFNQTPTGSPFTFRLLLDVDQVGAGKDAITRLRDVVNSTKNLRSHMSEIALSATSKSNPSVAIVAGVGNEITSSGFGYSLKHDGSIKHDGTYRHNGIKLPITN